MSFPTFNFWLKETSFKISRIKSNHQIESEIKGTKESTFNSRNKSPNNKVYTVSSWINNRLNQADENNDVSSYSKTKFNQDIYGRKGMVLIEISYLYHFLGDNNNDYRPGSSNFRIK